MVQSVAVVRATLTATGSGTTDFTKASFGDVAAALIFVCEANSGANPAANALMSIGFWDGTNQRVLMGYGEDGGANSNARARTDDSFAVVTRDGASNSDYTCSAITDGIRLTLTNDNTTLQRFCTVLLLGGVSKAMGTFTPNSTQNLTTESASLGFAPELVFFLCRGQTTADSDGTGCIWTFGFAAADLTQRMISFAMEHVATNELGTLLYSESRVCGQNRNGTTTWNGEVTTMGADTFTMTTRDGGSGGDVCFYLALGGDLSFDCGTLTTPTSTGVDTIATDVAPDAILLGLTTSSDTTLKSNSEANGMMYGLADDNGEFCHNISIEDGNTTMNDNSAAQAAAVLDLDTSVGGARTDLIDATVSSLGASSFALNYSAVDATARKGFWVAFGEAGGGGGLSIPIAMHHYKQMMGVN